jgi:hypothetical protein
MKPTEKSPDIDTFLTALSGVDRKHEIRMNRCVFCSTVINPETDFEDEISRREFQISGICMTCQDKVFGVAS